MISIPPFFLLVPYALFMLGYVFFALANVISLTKYGARNAIGLMASFIFVSGTAIIIFLTWQSIGPMDWMTAVPVGEIPNISF